MTTYYVGSGGSDGSAGTSWATRKATLNGAEDIPVAAGDTVYVGPGTYRELLTCDISGSSGSPITYVADVSGAHTDGVGGRVRITGSDNDQSGTRANCINVNGKSYRTFQSFSLDGATTSLIASATAAANLTITDCTGLAEEAPFCVRLQAGPTNLLIDRCYFIGGPGTSSGSSATIATEHTSTINSGNVIRNSTLLSSYDGIYITGCGGTTIRNCLIAFHADDGIDLDNSIAGQTVTVNNCILLLNRGTAFEASSSGQLSENYNTLIGNASSRTNVATGGSSVTYHSGLALPILLATYRFDVPLLGELAEHSALRAITGTGAPSDDLFGIARPATASKIGWGPVQFMDVQRETTTVNNGSASLKLPDAGRVSFRVPTDGTEITVSVYVYREANYAGTNPQLVVRQPGQSDRTTTDAGSSGAWNQLSDTFTPAASPPWVDVELVSNNTATSGSYAVYADDLDVA